MLAASYPTKKAMREAKGTPLLYIETSILGPDYKGDGNYVVVGPSPYNRKWYGQVVVKGGVIHSVK